MTGQRVRTLAQDNSRTPFGQTDPTPASSMNNEKQVASKGFQEDKNAVQVIVNVLKIPLASHMSGKFSYAFSFLQGISLLEPS